jgi:ribosome recycling factor
MISTLETTISGAVAHLKQVYAGLQAGRASAAMVDDIQVESYGSMMPMKNVATISCPDTRTLRIEPWDKSIVGAIAKAITVADIGITPQNMGAYILLPVPPMTEDRRKKLVKGVHEEAERAKISIRTARQEAMKKIKADADLSEDEQKSLEKEAQELVDERNKEVDELCKKKETDIMTV